MSISAVSLISQALNGLEDRYDKSDGHNDTENRGCTDPKRFGRETSRPGVGQGDVEAAYDEV